MIVPTHREILLDEIRQTTHCIKSFDPGAQTLTIFCWPTHGQARVLPSALREYRRTHQFLGPCCLCPLLRQFSEGLDFIEAAIYVPPSGTYAGECIATCARSRCGYLVLLDRLYSKPGIPLKTFPLRDTSTLCPPQVLHLSETGRGRPLEHTYAHADLMLCFPANDASHQTDWRKFGKLDDMRRPGLSESEFRGLFVQCDWCKLITTRLVFCYHRCLVGPILVDRLMNGSDSELTEPE